MFEKALIDWFIPKTGLDKGKETTGSILDGHTPHATLSLKDVTHKIVNVEKVGNGWFAEITVAPSIKGMMLKKMLDDGCKLHLEPIGGLNDDGNSFEWISSLDINLIPKTK